MENWENYKLRVFPGDYGLDAIEPEILFILTYIKYMEYPVNVESSRFPMIYNIPALYTSVSNTSSNNEKKSYKNIRQIYSRFGFNDVPELDERLNISCQTDSKIFRKFIQKDILPVIQYNMWCNESVYKNVLYEYYKNLLPFPYNVYYTNKRRQKVMDNLTCSIEPRFVFSETEGWDNLEEKAKAALNILNQKLGKRQFFFENIISSVDIMLYGYLMPLLAAPVSPSTCHFREYIMELENISQLVYRIHNRLNPNAKKSYRYVKGPVDEELSSSPGIVLLAVACTASAMVLYGMISGVFARMRS